MIKREELSDPRSCMSRAADDEMTFVLLARDVAAPAAIEAWIRERIRLGKNTFHDPQIIEALAAMRRMGAHGDVTGQASSGCSWDRLFLVWRSQVEADAVFAITRDEGRAKEIASECNGWVEPQEWSDTLRRYV